MLLLDFLKIAKKCHKKNVLYSFSIYTTGVSTVCQKLKSMCKILLRSTVTVFWIAGALSNWYPFMCNFSIQSVPLNMQPKIYKIEKKLLYWINILQKLLEMGTMLPFTQCNPLLEISEYVPKHIGHNGVNFRGNTIFQCF